MGSVALQLSTDRQGILRPNAPHRRLPHFVISISRQWNISGKRRRHSAARCRSRANLRDLVLHPRPGQHRKHYRLRFYGTPNPDNGSQPRPTGSVLVYGFIGGSCTSTLDSAGNGSCTYSGELPGSPLYPAGIMVAQYSGDANYAAQSLSDVNLAAIVLTVSGPLQLAVGRHHALRGRSGGWVFGGRCHHSPQSGMDLFRAERRYGSAGTVTAIAVGTATITVMDPVSLANASVEIHSNSMTTITQDRLAGSRVRRAGPSPAPVIVFDPCRVVAPEERLPPGAVGQVPVERLAQSAGKIARRRVAEIALRLPVVDRITAVMPGRSRTWVIRSAAGRPSPRARLETRREVPGALPSSSSASAHRVRTTSMLVVSLLPPML